MPFENPSFEYITLYYISFCLQFYLMIILVLGSMLKYIFQDICQTHLIYIYNLTLSTNMICLVQTVCSYALCVIHFLHFGYFRF
jgi:hypothetical protein